MKIVSEIVEEAVTAIERTIRNNVPTETCPEKRAKNDWKKEQIRQALIERLQGQTVNAVGPKEMK